MSDLYREIEVYKQSYHDDNYANNMDDYGYMYESEEPPCQLSTSYSFSKQPQQPFNNYNTPCASTSAPAKPFNYSNVQVHLHQLSHNVFHCQQLQAVRSVHHFLNMLSTTVYWYHPKLYPTGSQTAWTRACRRACCKARNGIFLWPTSAVKIHCGWLPQSTWFTH